MVGAVILFACLALAGEPARITFIHPRSAVALSVGPYGIDVPVQTRIPSDARARWWILQWNGDSCGGQSARSLDGDHAPTVQPETLGQKLYTVRAGEGMCRFVAETQDGSGHLLSRGTFDLDVK